MNSSFVENSVEKFFGKGVDGLGSYITFAPSNKSKKKNETFII